LSQKRTFSNWLTNRYLLIVRNEEDFSEKRTIIFNYGRLILLLAFIFILSMTLSILSVNTVLKQWFDPRYAEMEANRQVLNLTLMLDSLQKEVQVKNNYIQNVKYILEGQNLDSLSSSKKVLSTSTLGDINLSPALSPLDSQFRAEYESSDLGLVSLNFNRSEDELREIVFFTPLEGIVTNNFDPKEDHFGIDIVSQENEPIKALADGIVIMASWTLDGGYVLVIQHSGNLISIYKHNSELLKSVGNFVESGEIVSIIGNTGELTSGPHLHFELWFKEQAVNPEDYVNVR
jgi:murein DD-endopeptidase MepM/ murein hydrolase activator NlpD|tara:strand:- start:45023 stop:45892 length:870 start_codon:yes stop_codon:yes gene_type:complete